MRVVHRQRGQALVLGMFLLVVVALLAFFQFSAGQSTAAKLRLVNATDAAAYSAGLWRARSMNYYAYANRAIIANEVAIAQATTLVSFARFLQGMVERASQVGRYWPGVRQALQAAEEVTRLGLQLTHYTAAVEVAARSGYNHALATSQQIIHVMTNSGIALSAIANEVIAQTDRRFHAFVMPKGIFDAADITKRYAGEDRGRLREVVMASRDAYTEARGQSIEQNCLGGVVREGQTELILDHESSLDRWQAYDTFSVHLPRKRLRCGLRERIPLAWGGGEVATDPKGTLDALGVMGQNASGQKTRNGSAYRRAAQDHAFWSSGTYFGLPSVYGLDFDSAALKKNDRFPVMQVGIVGRIKNPDAIGTAQNRQLGAGRVQPKDNFASERSPMLALSMAEVYFRRPPAADSRVEYASLYSPYWQVRLIPVPWHLRESLSLGYQFSNP
ncbi:MAG: Tad domain-containing protein [Lautropia sp.]|nr:Tad domain-containing protein [Lautropia sp.]